MSKSISIIDKDYKQWVKALVIRYRQSQIKAAVKVNKEVLRFYWELGKDIVERDAENHYGSRFYPSLSRDLKEALQTDGFSERNLRYMKSFYLLYNEQIVNLPQVVADSEKTILPQVDFLDTDLYERQGKALTNFNRTLPDETSDLARELTKDPYDFAFTGITGRYNERLLKDKLLGNITQFLIELGTGFAYVGKEYRLQVGEREQFIDLLFYNLKLSCYVIIEVKIGKFDFADIGQLGGYVVSCNHILRKEGRDNPTIGLLICKEKDRIQAQYALESSSQPIAISEYDLEKFFPEKLEGVIPTIEEIEAKLKE